MEPIASSFLILGCGFTGRRVAQRLLARGAEVIATTRDPARLTDLTGATIMTLNEALDEALDAMRPNVTVLHSVPTPRTGEADPEHIVERLRAKPPRRVVYLSTTGVYGSAHVVTEQTPAAPIDERTRKRIEIEDAIRQGPWQSLILRPAAIYGSGRGAHVAYKDGAYHPHDNFISRIHVDDLAAITEAALVSEITGAYPVADEEPATSREVFEFCQKLLGAPIHATLPPDAASTPHRQVRFSGNRKVDGSAIRNLLGVSLRYPSYRTGIPACLAAELSL